MNGKDRILAVAEYLEGNLGYLAMASGILVDGLTVEVDKFGDLVHVHNGIKPHCTVGIVSEIYNGAKVFVNGPREDDPIRRAVVDCLKKSISPAYFPR